MMNGRTTFDFPNHITMTENGTQIHIYTWFNKGINSGNFCFNIISGMS